MKTILYINQDKTQRNEFVLKMRSNFNVITSSSALTSFDTIKDDALEVAAVFCSEKITGIDPIDFCKLIRTDNKHDSMAFFLLSQNPENAEAKELIAAGVDEVFSFNFEFKKVINRIAFCLEYRSTIASSQISNEKRPEVTIGFAKRTFDIVVATCALIALSPVFLAVIIALKLESKGPVFYAAKRVGTGYKIFDFYKFRSMFVDADKKLADVKSMNQYASQDSKHQRDKACDVCTSAGKLCSPLLFIDGDEICENRYQKLKLSKNEGTFIKIANDPRVTKVGQFIRNTSIDELPQLLNVLKGEMSIVGNRPLPLYEAEQLTSDLWSQRFNAPAGITGLWQVEKRGGGSMSEEERKQLDNTYANNHSFLNDIYLIVKTIPALFQSENV